VKQSVPRRNERTEAARHRTGYPRMGTEDAGVERETPGLVCALYDDEAPLKGDGLLIYAARTAG